MSREFFSGLRAKLFASHALVALVGTLTFLVAVSIIAPLIFGNLMTGMMGQRRMMGMGDMGGMMESVSQAFGRTLLYSLLLAALMATATAATTGLFVARRITSPVRRMLEATRRISAGRYDERVPTGGDDEFGALSESFNAMAATLEETEQRRREFITDISHELRTPLSTLEGYMEGVMDGVVEPSEETWTLLYAETERMRRLVDDLGGLARAEAGRLDLHVAPASPEELVGRAVEGMIPLYAEKGVRLESAIPAETPPVLADSDRVVQVLTNLLSNALRHTPGGGHVTAGAETQKGRVLFRVSDTGEGIATDHLPHVFERFYRADRSRSRESGGAGLGLAISKALVEAMGGEMWAESEGQGRGAAFSFTLPASPPES